VARLGFGGAGEWLGSSASVPAATRRTSDGCGRARCGSASVVVARMHSSREGRKAGEEMRTDVRGPPISGSGFVVGEGAGRLVVLGRKAKWVGGLHRPVEKG
jgi:hypothetical protein